MLCLFKKPYIALGFATSGPSRFSALLTRFAYKCRKSGKAGLRA
jgi:hypothetical protein